MLVSRADGAPLFYPAIYSVTQLRATNRAANTIEQALRAVAVLYTALRKLRVDLDARLAAGETLTLAELDFLVEMCGRSLRSIDSVPMTAIETRSKEKTHLTLVQVADSYEVVSSDTSSTRLSYITDYLRWRVQYEVLRAPQVTEAGQHLASCYNEMLVALAAKASRGSNFGSREPRLGLCAEERGILLSAIRPDASENPWKGKRARARNEVAIRWLHDLGIRAGELLALKVSDIDFGRGEVVIDKRPHDKEDPRRKQPRAKTRGRLLSLDDDLVELTRKYISGVRRATPNAKAHSFLFVALDSGAPLSLSSLNKLFVTLRNRVPGLNETLCPHVLRHTWNDAFSELMDAASVPAEKEEKWRARLMGWSETSKSASVYTRRHTRRKAAEASLHLQAEMKRSNVRGR